MRLNWFYLFIAAFFVLMIGISLRYFRGSGHSSVGVTYAKEYKISADKSAVVSVVPVVPGQQVKAGDVLVELSSAELEIEIDKLENRILAMKADQVEKAKLAVSEIALIRAEQGIEIEELTTDIVQAEGELQLNRKLTKELSGTTATETDDHPLEKKIQSLKQQRARHEEATAIKIRDIQQESETEQRLLETQVKLLERELMLLLDEKKKLSKTATSDGVIENVYVKQGEQVDAYAALLSINPVHPTTVVGYLVGKKDELPIGSEVVIKSYDHPNTSIAGKVIGYGAVVELPEILQKSTAVKAFGREVFIEIAPQNGFATGEKVLIR
jgi:HlyD family secretion protein